MEDYNTQPGTAKLNLVFFDYAVEHICRISRILRQPRGNIMLIGVGGSGKQVLTKLSSFMLKQQFKQIELKKNYTLDNFRAFIKDLMKTTGIEGKPCCFCITDNQIVSESFLEDINNLLNTGEVPNLNAPEEIDKIINDMRPIVIELKKNESRSSIYATFVDRVRDNLHIDLCVSPIGDNLRIRCRKFPSLVNCCTLDWFSRWPDEALLSVSLRFLQDIDLPSDDIRKALANQSTQIHINVEEMAEKFFNELRRKVYVTPKSFLDMILLYMSILQSKREEYTSNRNRLTGGIKTLIDTNKNIAELKIALVKLQPQLIDKSQKLEEALKKVNEDQKFANEKEKIVTQQSMAVNEKAKEAKKIADEAQFELDLLKPEVDAALNEVKHLDKKSIQEIKTFNNPPPLVAFLMEGVMLLLGEKQDWANVRVVLSDSGSFLDRLVGFSDKIGHISDNIIKKLKINYTSKPELDPIEIGKKALAAKSICVWLKAMVNFYDVLKKVEPKQKKYEEEKVKLDKANAELAITMKELEEIQAKVNKLKEDCNVLLLERDKLANEIEQTQSRLSRAEKLTVLLADEGVRWDRSAKEILDETFKLVGSVFLSAAYISYIGPFTGQYREEMIKKWEEECSSLNIPIINNYRFPRIMGDSILIRDWMNLGLPTDNVSIDNAIISQNGKRWPLMIDPQQQANKWIKNCEKKNDLKILKLTSKDVGSSKEKDREFIRTLTGSIRIGKPILIEDLEETFDPSLDPLLQKQFNENSSGIKFIHLDDKDIEYDQSFRFYMTSKLPNPHYLPEVCISVTLINFTVTFKGLEDQLLSDVVIKEKPEIEKKRDEITVRLASDKKTLKEIENKILKMLSNSTLEQILDSDNLINTLDESKKTATEIGIRVEQSAKLEIEIENARNGFRGIAQRGSIIYFVIADLVGIDSMYQYSLDYIKRLFNIAIDKSPQCDSFHEREAVLKDNITKIIFSNVSRGLFEAHKNIFSFLIATKIQIQDKTISDLEWNYLMRGVPGYSGKNKAVNPCPQALQEKSWNLFLNMEETIENKFKGFTESIIRNKQEWIKSISEEDTNKIMFPNDWDTRITSFEKLLITNAWRPEKLLLSISTYIEKEYGKFYIEHAASSMETLYNDSDMITPIIFILSQGADPTVMLMKFVKEKGYSERMSVVSLGQNQGPLAKEMIVAAQNKGDWVLLQNCHLCKSWMKELERVVDGFKEDAKTTNPDFRLFLTSMPADYFPATILQNGLKLTTEPPRGIRANLKRNYQEISNEIFEGCKKMDSWIKLLFGLSFFHALVQERRKFGALGFNIRYEFNDSDLDTSLTMLRMFLDEGDEIPWDAMNYVTGDINYGGRVTDDWDRRCLLCILGVFYNPEILKPEYKFSISGNYHVPEIQKLEEFKKYIDALPINDPPEVFGMNTNANITFQSYESNSIMRTIFSLLPRIGLISSGKSSDQVCLDLILDLSTKLPELIKIEDGKEELFVKTETGLIPSLSTVLLQEIDRFNKLLRTINSSIINLQKAIKGLIVMSQELENMFYSILNSQVPQNWVKVAYPSLKSLSSWFLDLVKRVDFMKKWLIQGIPYSFWLSGFFFPQGFMTGLLQTHARKYKIEIDRLNFSFICLQETVDEIVSSPEDGVYIYGLFLDGAGWNKEEEKLRDQNPNEIFCEMPVIHFNPVEDYEPPPNSYPCPVYKTSLRYGVLSTTGQSTNFILPIDLNSDQTSDFWTIRGTAILCQLDK